MKEVLLLSSKNITFVKSRANEILKFLSHNWFAPTLFMAHLASLKKHLALEFCLSFETTKLMCKEKVVKTQFIIETFYYKIFLQNGQLNGKLDLSRKPFLNLKILLIRLSLNWKLEIRLQFNRCNYYEQKFLLFCKQLEMIRTIFD